MIKSFANQGSEDVYHGKNSAAAVKVCSPLAQKTARRKLDQVHAVRQLRELTQPPGNHLEPLKGKREGQHSIRVNDQYRVCFTWRDGDAYDVEVTDYH